MYGWKVEPDSETGGFTHAIQGGRGHPLLVPLVSNIFQQLGVTASLCDGRLWWPIHSAPSLIPFEVGHAQELDRWGYNGKNLAKVQATKKVVRGTYSKLHDIFVPILFDDRVAAVMVVGPFFTSRPSAASILDRWRWLTGRQGHPADPEFAAYLRLTLDTLVLEGDMVGAFERLLVLLARLMSEEGRADRIANQADLLRRELEPVRFAERMWEAARTIIDEHASHIEHSAARHYDLNRMGLSVAPNQILVGLCLPRGREIDPVEDLVHKDAFARGAVELATRAGDAICGKVGDNGVVFLFSSRAPATREKRRRLVELADRVAQLGKTRFGLSVHCGASAPSRSTDLGQSYQAALGAAELALTQGKRLIVAESTEARHVPAFWTLREELARSAHEHADRLPAMFDRYIEAVTALSGHRMEPARAELQVCVERVADTLLQSGALDRKGSLAMRDRLDRSLCASTTLTELVAAYRTAIADLSAAAERPASARQARGLRGALEHIHQHYSEPLSLEGVAKVSGFARTYFSELFKQQQGMTFQRYLFALRVERAKKLLTGTDLSVTRVAELSGHRSTAYLCRVFRRVVGTTPLDYRRGVAPHRLRVHPKSERSTI